MCRSKEGGGKVHTTIALIPTTAITIPTTATAAAVADAPLSARRATPPLLCKRLAAARLQQRRQHGRRGAALAEANHAVKGPLLRQHRRQRVEAARKAAVRRRLSAGRLAPPAPGVQSIVGVIVIVDDVVVTVLGGGGDGGAGRGRCRRARDVGSAQLQRRRRVDELDGGGDGDGPAGEGALEMLAQGVCLAAEGGAGLCIACMPP